MSLLCAICIVGVFLVDLSPSFRFALTVADAFLAICCFTISFLVVITGWLAAIINCLIACGLIACGLTALLAALLAPISSLGVPADVSVPHTVLDEAVADCRFRS